MSGPFHTITLISYKSKGAKWRALLLGRALRLPATDASLQVNQGRPCSPALAQDHSLQGHGGFGDEEGMLSFPQVPSLQNPFLIFALTLPNHLILSSQEPAVRTVSASCACGRLRVSTAPEQADLPPVWGRRHQLGFLGKTIWLRNPLVVGSDQPVIVRARQNPETRSKASVPTVAFV